MALPTFVKTFAAVALLLGSTAVPAAADEPVCTRVFGFSQTRDWFAQFETQPGINNAEWEGVVLSSASIPYWVNPNAPGWTDSKLLTSKCPIAPTRAVYQVAYGPYATTSDATMQAGLRTVIANVRTRWPTVGEIILVPVIGGPGHGLCYANVQKQGVVVDATVMHPRMDALIAAVTDLATTGPDLLVRDCSDYRDITGHLTLSGNQYIASVMAESVP